jgi:hypothetical protein
MSISSKGRQAALKAWNTIRARKARVGGPNDELENRLRVSMRGSINFATRRQAVKAAKGRPTVQVTVTVEQLMEKLRVNDYCCALTGLPFWDDDADRFGPTIPTLDRMDCDGDYSDANVRVVLLGVNGLRGRGSEADMYRIAKALTDRAPPQTTRQARGSRS